ncbi:MAG TPA: WS/DGAT domain-containing protein, partial [Nocardioides sp.]|nr:WS/DGAT domain-containing protein [Nocardioides sp.]
SAGAEGGNAVGSVMVKLETQTADAGTRLAAINASMTSGKEALAAMTPAQIVAVSGVGMLPALALPALGVYGVRPFNLVISNVPGAREVQYFNGARLTDTYPVSIPLNGFALNITCNSYADRMGFGLTGCRRAVPHLQRLLGHLEAELTALEAAAGLT